MSAISNNLVVTLVKISIIEAAFYDWPGDYCPVSRPSLRWPEAWGPWCTRDRPAGPAIAKVIEAAALDHWPNPLPTSAQHTSQSLGTLTLSLITVSGNLTLIQKLKIGATMTMTLTRIVIASTCS